MFQPEYRTLIDTLIQSTRQSALQWEKGDGPLSYYTIVSSHQKILIDKYFSIMNGQRITCVNLTIFNPDGEIFDENVICNTPDLVEDFTLLSGLYDEIITKKISPTLTQITQSLQHPNAQHS